MSTNSNMFEGKELTGDIFNKLFQDMCFVKLTNEEENHNGFQFEDGLNIDTKEFTPYGSCNVGGLYFIQKKYEYKWLNYGNAGPMKYVRRVIVPYDARVYIDNGKFKADKLFLCPREEITKDKWFEAVDKQ